MWVRTTNPAGHECLLPDITGPARCGDLWRCDDCETLWRVGQACGRCDAAGAPWPHKGWHAFGLVWRPAPLMQRLLYGGR